MPGRAWQSAVLACVFAAGLWAAPASGRCLPPLFDEGRRLHELEGASLFDIGVLFSQHELCHRTRQDPDEMRVLLFGNSAVFGTRLSADRTTAHLLNAWLDRSARGAHVHNLAFATAYQLKDAMLMRAAIDWQPDVIVRGTSLADFRHVAPMFWPETLSGFMAANRGWLSTLHREDAPGLVEVVDIYLQSVGEPGGFERGLELMRALGGYLRLSVRLASRATAHADWLGGWETEKGAEALLGMRTYDCAGLVERHAEEYDGWAEWNGLAHLESLAQRSGARVLLVNWPILHDARGECHNRIHPERDLAAFNAWLREEAAARDFAYLDLHGLLSLDEFRDAVHPNGRGHARIAERIRPILEGLLVEVEASRGPER